MFRRLRGRIIFSFCVLMVGGVVFSGYMVSRQLTQKLRETVDQGGHAQAQVLARQLTEPIAYADHLGVRNLLTTAQEANPDLAYVFIVGPDGRVRDHSFSASRFPTDLLGVAATTEPATLATERGRIRNLPHPIADGELGVLHLGVSMAWVDTATADAVENLLATGVVAMFVGVLGILFLADLITRPLLAVRAAAVRLGEGELGTEAPVVGSDELADLARSFNRMAGQIRGRMEESEALRSYMERVLDQMDSSIVVVSKDRQIQYVNRMAEECIGPLEGVDCQSNMKGERPCHACPADEVLETGQVAHRRFEAPSGRTYELRWLPILGKDGKPAVVERALDITERLEMRERLEHAQRLAAAGEAAAGIVHSVNNPLDGVRRALEMAANRPDDRDRVARMLALAQEGTDRIANITHTLLGFARGRRELDPAPVEASSLVDAAVSLSQLRGESKGVALEADVAPDLPCVWLDPQGMEEVLVNLLLNAVDACAGGGQVRISAAWGEGLEIAVDDSGHGVPPEVAERVFEPFFTTKDSASGTGLGLAMARRMVEAHGGTLGLEASPLGGARFVVRLPSVPTEVLTEARHA